MAGPDLLAALNALSAKALKIICSITPKSSWRACASLDTFDPSCRCDHWPTSITWDLPGLPGLMVKDGDRLGEFFCHFPHYPWMNLIWSHLWVSKLMVQQVNNYFLLGFRGSFLLPVPVYQLRWLIAPRIPGLTVTDWAKEGIEYFSLFLILGDSVPSSSNNGWRFSLAFFLLLMFL